jgi:hypothetical protein
MAQKPLVKLFLAKLPTNVKVTLVNKMYLGGAGVATGGGRWQFPWDPELKLTPEIQRKPFK